MVVSKLSIQELENYFNLTCKVRDSVIMMARANNDLNSSKVRGINNTYNILLTEIRKRLDNLEINEQNNIENGEGETDA